MKIEGERPAYIDVLPHYFRKLDPTSIPYSTQLTTPFFIYFQRKFVVNINSIDKKSYVCIRIEYRIFLI